MTLDDDSCVKTAESIPLTIFSVFHTHKNGERESKTNQNEGKKEINIRGQHSKNLDLLYSVFTRIQITHHVSLYIE